MWLVPTDRFEQRVPLDDGAQFEISRIQVNESLAERKRALEKSGHLPNARLNSRRRSHVQSDQLRSAAIGANPQNNSGILQRLLEHIAQGTAVSGQQPTTEAASTQFRHSSSSENELQFDKNA